MILQIFCYNFLAVPITSTKWACAHHTDFSSLARFKRYINSIDFSDYLEFV